MHELESLSARVGYSLSLRPLNGDAYGHGRHLSTFDWNQIVLRQVLGHRSSRTGDSESSV